MVKVMEASGGFPESETLRLVGDNGGIVKKVGWWAW